MMHKHTSSSGFSSLESRYCSFFQQAELFSGSSGSGMEFLSQSFNLTGQREKLQARLSAQIGPDATRGMNMAIEQGTRILQHGGGALMTSTMEGLSRFDPARCDLRQMGISVRGCECHCPQAFMLEVQPMVGPCMVIESDCIDDEYVCRIPDNCYDCCSCRDSQGRRGYVPPRQSPPPTITRPPVATDGTTATLERALRDNQTVGKKLEAALEKLIALLPQILKDLTAARATPAQSSTPPSTVTVTPPIGATTPSTPSGAVPPPATGTQPTLPGGQAPAQPSAPAATRSPAEVEQQEKAELEKRLASAAASHADVITTLAPSSKEAQITYSGVLTPRVLRGTQIESEVKIREEIASFRQRIENLKSWFGDLRSVPGNTEMKHDIRGENEVSFWYEGMSTRSSLKYADIASKEAVIAAAKKLRIAALTEFAKANTPAVMTIAFDVETMTLSYKSASGKAYERKVPMNAVTKADIEAAIRTEAEKLKKGVDALATHLEATGLGPVTFTIIDETHVQIHYKGKDVLLDVSTLVPVRLKTYVQESAASLVVHQDHPIVAYNIERVKATNHKFAVSYRGRRDEFDISPLTTFADIQAAVLAGVTTAVDKLVVPTVEFMDPENLLRINGEKYRINFDFSKITYYGISISRWLNITLGSNVGDKAPTIAFVTKVEKAGTDLQITFKPDLNQQQLKNMLEHLNDLHNRWDALGPLELGLKAIKSKLEGEGIKKAELRQILDFVNGTHPATVTISEPELKKLDTLPKNTSTREVTMNVLKPADPVLDALRPIIAAINANRTAATPPVPVLPDPSVAGNYPHNLKVGLEFEHVKP